MATASLHVSAPQSPYRDCRISLLEAADPTAPARAVCTDVDSGLIIGSPLISQGRGDGEQNINAEESIRMIGGTYRLAAIAVEIATEELSRKNRRISDNLRLRRRLWRRRRRSQNP